MKCGFYEMDITPALGSIIPGDFAARYASEVLDPLFVRVFAVRSDTASLAIASVDTVGITADITARIRSRVCSLIPMEPDSIMVMATHAHGGGPTLNWGEEVVRDEAYLQLLVERTADSIVCAWEKAADSQLSVGTEELTDMSFIRVYRMKDGSLKTNPGFDNADKIDTPTTSIDPSVLVLAVQQGGIYTGAVINYANHPAIVATRQISGDYISALSAELKNTYGKQFVTVFVNGACGNINHINPFDRQTRLPGRHYVIGKALADKVTAAIASAQPMEDETLRAATGSLTVKFRKPSAEALLEAKKVFDALGDGLINSIPGTAGYQSTFFALQAFKIQADKRTQRDMQLQILRIGKCYIFGTPCQIFVQFGKTMKEGCDGPCFVSAFANDYCGYVPTPDCMRPGVYEATLAPTSALESAAGDKLCNAMLALYETCK